MLPLASLSSFIENVGSEHPYAVVFGALMLAGIGLPMPEDIPLLLGGFWCASKEADRPHPHIAVMLIGAFICILIGDLLSFGAGRIWGPSIHQHPRIERLIGTQKLESAKKLCRKRGGWFIIMARFLPGVRTPAFFVAGSLKMKLRVFLLCDSAAAMISAPLIVLAGYFFHDSLDAVKTQVKHAEMGGIAVVLVIVAALVVYKILAKRKFDKMAAETAKLSAAAAGTSAQFDPTESSPPGGL